MSANAIETLRGLYLSTSLDGLTGDQQRLMQESYDALAAVEALLEAAKAHLTHTDHFCVDKDDEADLTCPTYRTLAAAVRRVETGQ